MPPQLLERCRRRGHNAAPPAALCQPTAQKQATARQLGWQP